MRISLGRFNRAAPCAGQDAAVALFGLAALVLGACNSGIAPEAEGAAEFVSMTYGNWEWENYVPDAADQEPLGASVSAATREGECAAVTFDPPDGEQAVAFVRQRPNEEWRLTSVRRPEDIEQASDMGEVVGLLSDASSLCWARPDSTPQAGRWDQPAPDPYLADNVLIGAPDPAVENDAECTGGAIAGEIANDDELDSHLTLQSVGLAVEDSNITATFHPEAVPGLDAYGRSSVAYRLVVVGANGEYYYAGVTHQSFDELWIAGWARSDSLRRSGDVAPEQVTGWRTDEEVGLTFSREAIEWLEPPWGWFATASAVDGFDSDLAARVGGCPSAFAGWTPEFVPLSPSLVSAIREWPGSEDVTPPVDEEWAPLEDCTGGTSACSHGPATQPELRDEWVAAGFMEAWSDQDRQAAMAYADTHVIEEVFASSLPAAGWSISSTDEQGRTADEKRQEYQHHETGQTLVLYLRPINDRPYYRVVDADSSP